MTFIYIVKKIAQKWLSNMAKDQMAQKLVVHENLSIQTAKHALKSQNNNAEENS